MFIDELYSKLKRIQEMDFLDKQRSARLITDKSILRENGSAYVPFSTSQLESTNNSFRHFASRNIHFFNNENKGDRLNLYNHHRVEQQCDERIKSIVRFTIFFYQSMAVVSLYSFSFFKFKLIYLFIFLFVFRWKLKRNQHLQA